MGEFDLLALMRAAKASSDKKKARYLYARKMGFSGTESAILQNRSEELIRKLADERKESAGAK